MRKTEALPRRKTYIQKQCNSVQKHKPFQKIPCARISCANEYTIKILTTTTLSTSHLL
jgi:hypothetical protein